MWLSQDDRLGMLPVGEGTAIVLLLQLNSALGSTVHHGSMGALSILAIGTHNFLIGN